MPVALPPTDPRWANVTALAAVEPTELKKNGGFVPGEKPPAQYLNWLFATLYAWFLYFKDAANQTYTSAGNPGPWTGTHDFRAGITISSKIPTANVQVEIPASTSGTNVVAIDVTGKGTGVAINAAGGTGTCCSFAATGTLPVVTCTNTGTGAGLRATGGASAEGLKGTGGGSGGTGVIGLGGAGGDGIGGDFTSTGNGVACKATSSGSGPAVDGNCSGSGSGVHGGAGGVGGTNAAILGNAAGSARAVWGISAGTGTAGEFTSAGGSGIAFKATGNAASPAAEVFAGGNQPAVVAQSAVGKTCYQADQGIVVFTNYYPTGVDLGVNNALCAANVVNAAVRAVTTNTSGAVTIGHNHNIASVVAMANVTGAPDNLPGFRITFVRPFANPNAYTAVGSLFCGNTGTGSITGYPHVWAQAAGHCDIVLLDNTGAAKDPSTKSGLGFSMHFMGAQ